MLSIVKNSELTSCFTQNAEAILRPVQDQDLVDLQIILNDNENADPYQSSAGYFAMTGREGLWLVKEGKNAVLLCRHPNIDGEFLIFPPIGQNGIALMAKTITAVSKTGVNISLARADQSIANQLTNAYPNIELCHKSEKILDWTYPIHTVSTDKVVSYTGGEFQQFRTKINKLNFENIETFDLEPNIHRKVVEDICLNWGHGDSEKIAPYKRLLDLFDKLPMAGRVIYYEGKPAGFSIWEETVPKQGMANAYAHVGLHEVEGMSRYVMFDMCKTLSKNGFERVCIGGSESAGLDQFKRQMRPVHTVHLGSSWEVGSVDLKKTANFTPVSKIKMMQTSFK